MNNFQTVAAMNEAFGNPRGSLSSVDWPRISQQAKCIPSELSELAKAVAEGDTHAARDAWADIIVFAYGGLHLMGADGHDDVDVVVAAVMTRFCSNEQELEDTVAFYTERGVTFTVHGEFPRVFLKSDRDQGDGEYPKGKFLKNVHYRQPVFKDPT